MTKKRVTAYILCLILLLSLSGTALAAEGEAVAVSTREDLLRLADDPAGSYYLAADLDLGGADWTPIAFRGKLDGRGHTIYNLRVTAPGSEHADTVDGNGKLYDSVFAGLFSTLTDAEVRDLTLRGVDMDVTAQQHCFIGALAGYMKDAVLTNCAVLDARLSLTARCSPETDNPRKSCNAGIGGLVGFGYGIMTGCRAETALVFVDQCDAALRCEEFMGGLLSTGNAAVSDCAVVIDGYDECRGYAHNGGLIGMTYAYGAGVLPQMVTRCSVEGSITFFEDNNDRRAYCQAFIGEMLPWGNIGECTQNFVRNEVFDYTAVLRPEKCAEPSVTDTVYSPDCTNAGYTEHTCAGCGYTWRDSFTLPAHQPGEWVIARDATFEESGLRTLSCTVCGQILQEEEIAPHVAGEWQLVKEPEYNVPGLNQQLCTDCGAVLAEEPIPALVPVSSITLNHADITLDYKDSETITSVVLPADAHDPIVHWTSSDPEVVTVDTDGTVHAVGKGTAVVKCTSADGFAEAECRVTVNLTIWQWIREYILFGWVKRH